MMPMLAGRKRQRALLGTYMEGSQVTKVSIAIAKSDNEAKHVSGNASYIFHGV